MRLSHFLAAGIAMASLAPMHEVNIDSTPAPVKKKDMGPKWFSKRKKRLSMAKQSRKLNRA